MKQWARNYLQAMESSSYPRKHARIRTYLLAGMQTFKMAIIATTIPTLLHMSLFLFFAGLYIFLRGVSSLLSVITLFILIMSACLYITTTALPTVYPNCPVRTPFSDLWWRFTRLQRDTTSSCYSMTNLQTIKNMEIAAIESSKDLAERDFEALKWTILGLHKAEELADFITRIPGFIQSTGPQHSVHIFSRLFKQRDLSFGPCLIQIMRNCEGLHPLQCGRKGCAAVISSFANVMPDMEWF